LQMTLRIDGKSCTVVTDCHKNESMRYIHQSHVNNNLCLPRIGCDVENTLRLHLDNGMPVMNGGSIQYVGRTLSYCKLLARCLGDNLKFRISNSTQA
jgi:hypothetical protein